ncbi:MAG: DUF309 domain-containing protein [Rhodobacteraceae bacterium]|nr:DUF309 domain-containing protein [Paracoccaceae bacterium]
MIRLPPEPHLPGRTPRPDPALFAPLLAGVQGSDAAALSGGAAFRAGFDAFAAGYYWEAHEFWEPVWAALPPASAERHLLRGLIQLANAGLKRRMDRPGAARRILQLAESALDEAFGTRRSRVMGVDRARIGGLMAQLDAISAL